jgi:hypothetical protein
VILSSALPTGLWGDLIIYVAFPFVQYEHRVVVVIVWVKESLEMKLATVMALQIFVLDMVLLHDVWIGMGMMLGLGFLMVVVVVSSFWVAV